MPKTFVLTEDHLKLLGRMWVGWQDCETGAPEIDPKRPYGNSSVWRDVAEILGWEVPEAETAGADEERETLRKRADMLHRETEDALQICLQFREFRLGTFRERPYSWPRWERVE